MIISDLNHLEVVSEADNLVGGHKQDKGKNDKPKSHKTKSLVKFELNLATVTQTATNVVIGGGKDSYTKGFISQYASVEQS